MTSRIPSWRTLAGALALGLALASPAAEAAARTMNFTGTLDSGSYLGESFSGFVSFDDDTLAGVSNEWLAVSNMQLTFHGHTYGLADASAPAEVAFLDGSFLGLAYTAEAGFPKLTTVAGSVDSSDAFLAYDLPAPALSGAGTMVYSLAAVPDAPGAVLALVGLGALAAGRRRARAG